MRTRKEIEHDMEHNYTDDYACTRTYNATPEEMNRLILEVLLDIRDILQEGKP